MTITISVSNKTGTINNPVTITPIITSDIAIKNIEWLCNKPVNFSVTQDQKTLRFTPSADGQYVFTVTVWDINGNRLSKTSTITVGAVTPTPTPTPTPEPTTGTVIYDSHINSKLHDGKVRTVTQEGSITPGGLGAECRASGNPKIVVNADGTFSLVTGSGVVETLSLRLRSRHNEPDPCDNRFGGYGFAVKRTEYDAKRETCHNIHDQSTTGSIPTLTNGTYFKIEFTIKDESGKVRWIAKVNGTQVMSKLTDRQAADPALFNQQSYIWLRANNSDFGRIYVYVKNYNAKLEVEAKFDSGNSVTFKSVRVIAI